MNIYTDYLENIRTAMASDRRDINFSEGLAGVNDHIRKGMSLQALRSQAAKKELLPSMESFANELGTRVNFEQQLGLHPDFAYLKESLQTENHYIASMFIDIKGSTNLFKRYSPETVFVITNTIQKAAIHTCLIFGGYIHRMQGDGLFVYYGRKGLDKSTAVLNALKSSSVFTYFVKNDLRELLNEQGIEDIYTRIGIDLGYDSDVIWALAGIGEISEVTTCSLHTSLASKMQGHAVSNGIVIGDNIKNEVGSLQEFFTPVCLRTGEEKHRYIFRNPERAFNYTQHDFHWHTFLKQLDFIATDLEGRLSFKLKSPIKPKVSDHIKPIAVLNKPYLK